MSLVDGIKGLMGHVARFGRDDRGAVSVDFVVAIPILLAVLVFTSEYGRVLQMRTVLDNAVADATRYLARAPLNASGDGFPAEVVTFAEAIITSRITVDEIAIATPVLGDVTNATSSASFRTVSLTVSIGVETPAISAISLANYSSAEPSITGEDSNGAEYTIALNEIEGFVLTASSTARHFGL